MPLRTISQIAHPGNLSLRVTRPGLTRIGQRCYARRALSISNVNDWLERARSLAPLVEAHRDEGEALRHLPPVLVDAMREQGLFALWLPRALGGPQLRIETCVRVME